MRFHEEQGVAVKVDQNEISVWFEVPSSRVVTFIADRNILPFIDLNRMSFLETVRDLMLAGF